MFHGSKWESSVVELQKLLTDPKFIKVHCLNGGYKVDELRVRVFSKIVDFEKKFKVIDNPKPTAAGFDIIIYSTNCTNLYQANVEKAKIELAEALTLVTKAHATLLEAEKIYLDKMNEVRELIQKSPIMGLFILQSNKK